MKLWVILIGLAVAVVVAWVLTENDVKNPLGKIFGGNK